MNEVAAQVEDPALSQALRDFAGAFQEFADAGLGPQTGLTDAFRALDGIKNLVAGAESLIVDLEAAGIDTEPFAPIIEALRAAQVAMYEAAQEAALAIQQGFEQTGETAETAAEGFSGTFNGSFSEMVGMIGESLMDGLGKMARDFMAFIGSIPESVAAIGNATETASEQIGAAHGSYAEAFAAGAAEIGDTLAGLEQALGNATSNVADTVASGADSIAEAAADFGNTVGSGFEGGPADAPGGGGNPGASAEGFGAAGDFGIWRGGLIPRDLIRLYQGGGRVSGPGTGTSDSIVARLSNGEYVVNAASTQRYLPLLEAINDNSRPRFQTGGLVTGGGGGGTVVEINDFRGSEAPPVEVRQTRDPDGGQRIKVEIRDAVLELFEEGELDSAVDNRFGVRPAVA